MRRIITMPNERIYQTLLAFGGHWLASANLNSEEDFVEWVGETRAEFYAWDDGVVIVTNLVPGLRATIHPLFWNKAAVNAPQILKEQLKVLFVLLDVARIEARVLETAGHTLRKLLRSLGFRLEGTLRAHDIDHLNPEKPLISTEIWAILRMEILEVFHG